MPCSDCEKKAMAAKQALIAAKKKRRDAAKQPSTEAHLRAQQLKRNR